ncbi:hypothetical protein [Streptomyces sp. DH12]|uniref:hypothetical protein n=1 Tax=Streptomyces sp. DH12 TaxID=2857010 RepID=UPI001E3295B9|nr:hypothetical protein [Streptomyces sp. DH12]
MTTTYLSAEQILGADDLTAEDVPVPEWGGTVRVRALSGTERDRIEASMMNGTSVSADKLAGFRARMAAASIVGPDGKRMFRSDAETRRLGEKSAAALERVCDVAMRLSGLSDKDIEEITGN